MYLWPDSGMSLDEVEPERAGRAPGSPRTVHESDAFPVHGYLAHKKPPPPRTLQ